MAGNTQISLRKNCLARTVVYVLLLLPGCLEESVNLTELEKLPPATHAGKNTFGCLVNGEAWVTVSSIDAVALYQTGVLQISAGIREKGRHQSISIVILGDVTQGPPYNLTEDPQRQAGFSATRADGACYYVKENTLSGNLKITTLYKVGGIIAGTFEFTTHLDGCDTIKVTDGRFDLTF